MSTSFQVSIPMNVREKMNADSGDLILFFDRGGEIIIRTTLKESTIPSSNFQKLQDITEDTTIYLSKSEPVEIILFKWLNEERSEGMPIKLPFMQLVELVNSSLGKSSG